MSDNLEKFITPGQTFDLPKEKSHTFANERTERTEQGVPTSPTTQGEQLRRSSPKQRKASMEEYQQTYLATPCPDGE